MKRFFLHPVTAFLIIAGVSCKMETSNFDIRKEFFNIYKGIAVETKAITHTQVTRDQVTFTMYRNHQEPKEAIIKDNNLALLEGSKGHVVFITHGWTDHGDAEWVLEMKDSFLSTYPDIVVIAVDWREPARQVYSISSINTYDIGNIIGDTVGKLVDEHRLDIGQFILVGHSLGGQISGFAGKHLQKAGKKLQRIVALDPAGPLFDVRPVDKRLNPTDAEVVEVIHTDTGSFGFKDPCGTIDFYPNGGDFQAGCTRIDVFDASSIVDPIVCDHERSYYYFIDAVQHPKDYLVAMECTEWNFLRKVCNESNTVSMGDLTTTQTGTFYLTTNKEKPYGKKVLETADGLLDKMDKTKEAITDKASELGSSVKAGISKMGKSLSSFNFFGKSSKEE
ncbi:unnamed protein product [Phyllotreta striolata]|uniref:Lipase domain-containing protein n=1 Tax=Phyllotreta striolata TaxID=444603 RepID=A0A9N9XQP3_PHYSR|nr:unnamed protein product [Phyllotreta striolata]